MRKQSSATASSTGRVLARTLAESQAFAGVSGALVLPVEGGGTPVLTQVNGHLDWTNVGVDA
ncbi:MAG TPA: hypothetical protein VN851_05305 [Thermoanaerobaculia bacterium]|nr:hypothetical protein [Thermoanaerobaculia bacterium]